MRHFPSRLIVLGSSLLFVSGPAFAAVLVQTTNFNQTDTIPSPASGNQVGTSFFTATVNPFNSSMGTLNSFTVDWTVSVSATATTGAGGGGSGTMGLGGTYYINGIGYAGNGDGDGNGAGPSSTFSLNMGPTGDHHQYLPADAGGSYDPGILAAATGATPFNLRWDSPVSYSMTGVDSFTSTITGSATFTYDYTVPEPATTTTLAGLATLGFAGVRRWRRSDCRTRA